jgi:hypothetical protein
MNPYIYGISFPPQSWQSGRVVSLTDSFVIRSIHSLKNTYRHRAMSFSIVTPVPASTPSTRRHVRA